MTYKLFLDDYRTPPGADWKVVTNYAEFCFMIEEFGLPSIVSFDHDLADEHYCDNMYGRPEYGKYVEKTGYDCAKWLVEYCSSRKIQLPIWRVHSMNPVGSENISNLLCYHERRFSSGEF